MLTHLVNSIGVPADDTISRITNAAATRIRIHRSNRTYSENFLPNTLLSPFSYLWRDYTGITLTREWQLVRIKRISWLLSTDFMTLSPRTHNVFSYAVALLVMPTSAFVFGRFAAWLPI